MPVGMRSHGSDYSPNRIFIGADAAQVDRLVGLQRARQRYATAISTDGRSLGSFEEAMPRSVDPVDLKRKGDGDAVASSLGEAGWRMWFHSGNVGGKPRYFTRRGRKRGP